jgi:hypothetical protein
VVLFSAFALVAFVYALLAVAEPGALDAEADSDSPDWGVIARGATAFGIAMFFTVAAISMIDV